eukprot:TRINITY_DN1932_c0_g1_i11.p1 TRINITY_DN1932_c0_g1~~TRINITY_DN1932_c0_g1_i11.p1  ORF type:complete len:1200 (+),score=349.02 TRINITY_DN1932_c0_g1_i11:106-3705(+)
MAVGLVALLALAGEPQCPTPMWDCVHLVSGTAYGNAWNALRTATAPYSTLSAAGRRQLCSKERAMMADQCIERCPLRMAITSPPGLQMEFCVADNRFVPTYPGGHLDENHVMNNVEYDIEVAAFPNASRWGCQASNFDGKNFTGKIALVDRGGCLFPTKFLNAKAAGSVAGVLVNDRPGNDIVSAANLSMAGTAAGLETYPAVSAVPHYLNAVKEALDHGETVRGKFVCSCDGLVVPKPEEAAAWDGCPSVKMNDGAFCAAEPSAEARLCTRCPLSIGFKGAAPVCVWGNNLLPRRAANTFKAPLALNNAVWAELPRGGCTLSDYEGLEGKVVLAYAPAGCLEHDAVRYASTMKVAAVVFVNSVPQGLATLIEGPSSLVDIPVHSISNADFSGLLPWIMNSTTPFNATVPSGRPATLRALEVLVLTATPEEDVATVEETAIDVHEGPDSIGDAAFSSCRALRKLHLPETLTQIGASAFRGSGLETVVIPPAVTEIPAEAFKDCLSLTEVHMHDNVTHIDDGAFEGCASLTCVALPPNCTYGEAVFKGCGRLAAYAGGASENMSVVFAGSSCEDGSCKRVAQCGVRHEAGASSGGTLGISLGVTTTLLFLTAVLSSYCVWKRKQAVMYERAQWDPDLVSVKRRAALTAFGAEWHPDVVSLGREVGRGASGGVLLGTHVHTNAMVAVKTLPAGEHASEQELRMLQTLEHPRLVALWGHHTSPTATTLYMEYMSGGSLAQVVERQGRMHETALRRCVRDAAEGLAFLHGRGVVHRDVKPHNLLVDNGGQVKLADFGCSKDNVGKETLSTGVRGTPHYMAPEVATGLLSSASDMWSLGATAVHLASGRKPWDETGLGPLPLLAYLAQICDGEDVEGDVQPAVPEHLSPGARTSLLRCLSVQRGQRPSAAELLADAFLQDVTEPLPGTEAMANYTENVHPQGAPGLLSGTACVVFADVACGEALWRECAAGMGEGVAVYGKVVRAVAARHRGYEVKTIYDCFMMAFEGAEDGVRFGLEVQRALFDAEWPDALRECAACCDEEDAAAGWNGLRVQVGMDCGAVDVTFNAVMGRYDYFGPTVNRASRTKSQAVPGFVTMTPEVAAAAGSVLPDGVCVFEREGVRMAGIAEPTTLHNAVPEALAGRMAFARLWVAEKGAAESDGAAAASTNPLVVQRRAESVAAHADKSGVAEASDDHDALRTISVA